MAYPPPQPYQQIPAQQPAYWYPVDDPGELYYAGQDQRPAYLYEPARDNPAAITAFAFAICALGLLVVSGGFSFLASLPCAIAGIVVGRRGLKAAEADPATRHRNYARAGFVVGIVTTVLATLAAALFVLIAAFPELDDVEQSGRIPAVFALRLLGHALGF